MGDGDPDAADDDERATELSSIAAIYPEIIIDPSAPYVASIDIAVTPLAPITFRFLQSAKNPAQQLSILPESAEHSDSRASTPQALPSVEPADEHVITHLPPLTVHITLPERYPAHAPPKIRLSSTWIAEKTLESLEGDCERLWEDWGRGQIVYTYIDHLTLAAETAFDLDKDSHGFDLSSDLKLALLDFDLKTKRILFEKETFDCGICLEPKKGAVCHRLLLCGHVFCVACLQDFYNNCIIEGDVDNVKCLDPGCKGAEPPRQDTASRRKKQDRTINPSELLQIPIERELVQRFVRMKRKKKLEADKTTIYCPRQWCQGAARSKKHPKPQDPMNDHAESDSESESVETSSPQTKRNEDEYLPMSERLSICEDCTFAFCSVCKKGWHGEKAVCNPRRQNELNEEEKASLEYLQRYSTPCPTCSAPAQKIMGCNHMTCHLCKTHYCYLCSAYLMPDNPYSHYNDHKSTCYMRLWELEGGDGADVGRGYAGGAAAEWEADSNTDSEDDDGGIEEDDFADFAGDEPLIVLADEEDDSEDEEPAPDQRRPDRPMQIEMVNAAGQRIIHQLPDRPRPAPPAAPAPPPAARRGRRRRGQPQPPNHRAPVNHGRPPPAPANIRRALANPPAPARRALDVFVQMLADPEDDEDDGQDHPPMIRAAAAPGQGNAAAQQPAPVRAMGLERFLELANNDQEDEWDSDELDDDIEPELGDDFEPQLRLRARPRYI